MAIRVQGHDLVCTFYCLVDDSLTATEASLRLSIINFSEPALDLRDDITLFASVYCEFSNTVSVFTRNHGDQRVLTIRYSGIKLREEMCSRFYSEKSRLLCHLASSAAEVGYFNTDFTLYPPKATGNFVLAHASSGRTRLMKITLVDTRIQMLEPGPGQITHPLPFRFTLLNGSDCTQTAAGTLFVYVTLNHLQPPNDAHVRVKTSWGRLVVPKALVDNLRHVYPATTTMYPDHISEFMYYLDMERNGQIEGCHLTYLEDLGKKNLDQIMEVVILGIDFLKKPVLRRMFQIIGRKLDEFGPESLLESSVRLGFIVN